MTNKYAVLDAEILAAIAANQRTFIAIENCKSVRTESSFLAATSGELADAWRIVDRRLQALRKAGRIQHSRASKSNPDGGWTLAEAA